MRKREKKAYMTVEASFIIPVVLGGIALMIYLGMYLYNVSTVKQAAYIAALRGSQLKDVPKETVEIYVAQQLEELLMGRILAKSEVSQEIRVTDQKVRVKVRICMNIPFAPFLSVITDWGIVEGEAEAGRINPVDIIRDVRKIYGSQISQ